MALLSNFAFLWQVGLMLALAPSMWLASTSNLQPAACMFLESLWDFLLFKWGAALLTLGMTDLDSLRDK